MFLKDVVTFQDFNLHVGQTYKELYDEKKFTDVTLISDDQAEFPSHKFLLSSASKVFARILEKLPQYNPIIFLKGVSSTDLELLLKFLYYGQVKIPYSDVKNFQNTMEYFEIFQFHEIKNETVNSVDSGSKDLFNEAPTESIDKSIKSEKIQENVDESKISNMKKNKKAEDSIKAVENLKCGLCDYVACRKEALKKHLNVIHLNIRHSYSCDVCGKVFTSKNAVKFHNKTVHEGVQLHCDYEGCDFKTKHNQWLKNHKETHDSNILLCDQCEYKTQHHLSLKKHIKMHHSNLLRQCDQCDYQCKKSASLRLHIKVKHEGKRIPCDQCEFKATRLDNLKSHILKKHKKSEIIT